MKATIRFRLCRLSANIPAKCLGPCDPTVQIHYVGNKQSCSAVTLNKNWPLGAATAGHEEQETVMLAVPEVRCGIRSPANGAKLRAGLSNRPAAAGCVARFLGGHFLGAPFLAAPPARYSQSPRGLPLRTAPQSTPDPGRCDRRRARPFGTRSRGGCVQSVMFACSQSGMGLKTVSRGRALSCASRGIFNIRNRHPPY